MFEFDAFGAGTEAVAEAIADSDAFSLAGGGDTIAAIDKYGVADRISYISTGGGAFLEFVEGKKLPAVAMLEKRARKSAPGLRNRGRGSYDRGQGPETATVMPGYWMLTNRVLPSGAKQTPASSDPDQALSAIAYCVPSGRMATSPQ